MKAAVYHRFGSPDVLELQDVAQPALTDDGVLVRVRASSVNPAEWFAVTGRPYIARPAMGLRRPKQPVPGADLAGTVAAVGSAVTDLRPGDEVFGGASSGAFAEYVCVRQTVVAKPAKLTFEQAAAVPTAAVTALQGLRDHGRLWPGHAVLINGASGGVGTFAVQLAKAFGAEVTGVCSTHNVELVRSLGADHVVDYTQEDFTASGRRYDLLLDVGGEPVVVCLQAGPCPRCDPRACRRAQDQPLDRAAGSCGRRPSGVAAGQPEGGLLRGQVHPSGFPGPGELLEAGKLTPVIDRQYELAEVPAALNYLGGGHARAKVVITV